MIELRNVTKDYGEVQALRGITTTIRQGEIVGLLGPNGAGKTTAIKILVGYLLPTGGAARVAGVDVVENPLSVQRRIGYLPENAPSYGDMLVQEYLRFVAEMRGVGPGEIDRRIVRAAGRCAVDGVLTRPVGHLSKGYRQRVGLAAAILHDPEILILDEPTNGLDPNQIVEVRELIREMGRTKTVIVSTHILSEVEASCGRVVILIDGKIRADGTLADLTKSGSEVVRARGEDPEVMSVAMTGLGGVAGADHEGEDGGFHAFRLRLAGHRSVGEAVFGLARERGWTLAELRRDDRTLENVFRELTETGEETPA